LLRRSTQMPTPRSPGWQHCAVGFLPAEFATAICAGSDLSVQGLPLLYEGRELLDGTPGELRPGGPGRLLAADCAAVRRCLRKVRRWPFLDV
jgi:hypothetical protein